MISFAGYHNNRAKLLGLPMVDQNSPKYIGYDSVLIVPTFQLHEDTTFQLLAIVGMNGNEAVELAAIGDIINTSQVSVYADVTKQGFTRLHTINGKKLMVHGNGGLLDLVYA